VPLAQPALPAPRREASAEGHPTTVRRILFTPLQVRPAFRTATEVAGSFVVSGSWWGTQEQDSPFLRDYSFQDSPTGILWLFVDRLTGISWVQGTVD
jgi:hypothetical protein